MNDKNSKAGGDSACAVRCAVPAGGERAEPGMGHDAVPGGRV